MARTRELRLLIPSGINMEGSEGTFRAGGIFRAGYFLGRTPRISGPRASQKLSLRLSVLWGGRLGHLRPCQNLWTTNGAFFGLRTEPLGLWTDAFGLRSDPFGLRTDPLGNISDPKISVAHPVDLGTQH